MQKFVIATFLALMTLFFGSFHVVKAQDVTQGYQSDTTLQQGTIVQLDPNDPNKVEPLTESDETNMLGVVVAATDSPVSLSPDTTKVQTYVASFGQYEVLVNNQNGTIKPGDAISISMINGVGMKAGSDRRTIIGKAVQGFDGKSNVQSTIQVKSSLTNQTIAIGRIQVNISVAHNPAYNPVTAAAGVPGFLSRAAQVVTNKPVGAVRLYTSLIILMVCAFIAGIVLYSGVRTGIIASGRNPLAKKSILRNLIEVTLSAIIIFLIGLIAVYLLLKV